MKYLAVDFGEKRVGLAMCDPDEKLVAPLRRIDRRHDGQVASDIAEVVQQEQVEAVVVGLPVNMDDTEGPQARRIRQFAELLARRANVPIHFQNEQLSSFAADERLADRELTRGRHRRRQDSVAAAVILEDFLRKQRDSGA